MRSAGLKKKLETKFDEELKFIKGWIDKPKAVGAIMPTSMVTARRMASVVDISSGLPVLELGPGTGVITRAILAHGTRPEDLWSVEYSADFVAHLRGTLPAVNVVQGDAFALDTALPRPGMMFDSVVSAVPLLNFPTERRVAFVEDLLNRIPAGRPIVQISYGPLSPVPPRKGDYEVKRLDFVVRNIPPAQLWVYKRPAKSRAA